MVKSTENLEYEQQNQKEKGGKVTKPKTRTCRISKSHFPHNSFRAKKKKKIKFQPPQLTTVRI